MKTTDEITNSQDVIDSRDIIDRIESLESELMDAHEGETSEPEMGFDEWLEKATEYHTHPFTGAARELKTLRNLAEEASGSPDWQYGETLIRDSYFEEYAEQLADDIGAIDRSLSWPLNCIDWERAAMELKMDYMSVDFDGVEYWIRA